MKNANVSQRQIISLVSFQKYAASAGNSIVPAAVFDRQKRSLYTRRWSILQRGLKFRYHVLGPLGKCE